MFVKLLLAFTLAPTLELYILILVGQQIGALATVLIILATGSLGAALARREGGAVLGRLRDDLDRGLPPAAHLMEGALVLVGGVLLVTPGILTDIVGFSFIIPFTRRFLAPRIQRFLTRRFEPQGGSFSVGSPLPPDAEDPIHRKEGPWNEGPRNEERTDREDASDEDFPFDHVVR